jgi:hypothetical protein
MARRHAVKWWLALALIAFLAVGIYLRTRTRAPMAAVAHEPPPSEVQLLSSTPAIVAKPRASPAGKAGGDGIEICGVGKVRPAADDETAFRYVSKLAEPMLRRWFGAMRNSDDYRARAAGLFLSSFAQNPRDQQADAQTARDELVAMAAASTDPAIYAIGLRRCALNYADAANSCSQLSADRWSKLDPDNAVPWLLVAERAHANQDAVGEAAAFAAAGTAHRNESYTDSLLRLAEPDKPVDTTPLENWSMAIHIFGIEAASITPFGPAFSYCSKDAIQDKTVAERCAALAELWATKPGNIVNLMVGEKLGERVGWPQERLENLKERIAAYLQLLSEPTLLSGESPWSCEAVARGNALVVKLTQMGEVGAAQEMLDHAQESVAELAQKHEEATRKIIERAQKAAWEKPSP